MPTVPEFLRHDLIPGHPATVILRSGYEVTGILERVDLVANIVHLGGWALRVEEIAGARADVAGPREAAA